MNSLARYRVAINSGIFYYSLAVEADDINGLTLSTLVQEVYVISSYLHICNKLCILWLSSPFKGIKYLVVLLSNAFYVIRVLSGVVRMLILDRLIL